MHFGTGTEGFREGIVVSFDLNRELLELSQFVLNRKTTDIRLELYEHLVSFTLSRHQGTSGLTSAEVVSSVEHDYTLAHVPMLIVGKALDGLKRKAEAGSVDTDKGPVYFLTTEKLQRIAAMISNYEDIRRQVIDQFIAAVSQDVGKSITGPEREDLTRALYKIIGSLLARGGIACAEALTGVAKRNSDLASLLDIHKVVEDPIKIVREVGLREPFLRQFRLLVSRPDGKTARFLFSLAQSYAIAQTLNLDPELRGLEQAAISKRRVYLDTNMIVSAMCVGQMHEPAVKVIDLTRQLNIRMLFTKRTRREFLDLLRSSEISYDARARTLSPSIMSKAVEIMADPFVKSFWKEAQSGSKDSWDGFLAKMRSFDQQLKSSYEVEEDEQGYDEIQKSVSFDNTTTRVFTAAQMGKNERAAQHDAFHILLVKELRKSQPKDELGPTHWFLTRDCTLQYAELEEDPYEIPSSITIDAWLTLISPLLSPQVATQDAAEAFSQLLSSQLPQITESVNANDILAMIGPWIDIAGMNTEDIRKLIGDRYVLQCLEQLRQGTREEDVAKVRQSLDGITAKITDYVDKKRTEDKKEYTRQIDELQSLVKRGRVEWRLVAIGTLLVISLPLLSLLEARIGASIADKVYDWFGILAALFIGAGFFGRSVFELFLQKKGSES
jgi:hypothetical protein